MPRIQAGALAGRSIVYLVLIAFGIIGIFIGPVVLAVTYRLLGAWVEGEMDEAGMEIGSKG